jgi:hypothetical protein
VPDVATFPQLTDVRLRRARAASQLFDRRRRIGPAALVGHLVGVQAQVVEAAGLALRARAERLTEASVARSRAADRSIVLTWAMRRTMHLVAADDYGRFVPLLAEPTSPDPCAGCGRTAEVGRRRSMPADRDGTAFRGSVSTRTFAQLQARELRVRQ